MTTIRHSVSAMVLFGFLLSVPVSAETQLDATGIGMVSVAPDEASITAQVTLVDLDAGKAQKRASKKVNSILAAIKSFSIKPDSLNSSELSLVPEYRWDRTSEKQQFVGFRVKRTVSFTIDEIDRLGAALSALANAGATVIRPPVLGSSEAEKAKDEALSKAVADVRRKLKLLAEAADTSLSNITHISEVAPLSRAPAPTLMRREMALDSDASDNFLPGNLTFVSEVRAKAVAD